MKLFHQGLNATAGIGFYRGCDGVDDDAARWPIRPKLLEASTIFRAPATALRCGRRPSQRERLVASSASTTDCNSARRPAQAVATKPAQETERAFFIGNSSHRHLSRPRRLLIDLLAEPLRWLGHLERHPPRRDREPGFLKPSASASGPITAPEAPPVVGSNLHSRPRIRKSVQG